MEFEQQEPGEPPQTQKLLYGLHRRNTQQTFLPAKVQNSKFPPKKCSNKSSPRRLSLPQRLCITLGSSVA